jgi:hypothetical protein
MGMCGQEIRLPLVALTDEKMVVVRELLERFKLA